MPRSIVAASKPSTVVEPIFKFTLSPELATLSVLNDTPSLVTRSWARSQLENLVKGVTKTCSSQVGTIGDDGYRIAVRERLELRIGVVRQRREQREVGQRRDQAARQDES